MVGERTLVAFICCNTEHLYPLISYNNYLLYIKSFTLSKVVPTLIGDYLLARLCIHKNTIKVRMPKRPKPHIFAGPARLTRKIRRKGRYKRTCHMLWVNGFGNYAWAVMGENDNTAVRRLAR